ncbi:hypothetical protein HDU67_000680, partial [Dinochytrium kinnereticum]
MELDSSPGGDATAHRDVSLLQNLVNQVTTESRVLVNQFKNIIKKSKEATSRNDAIATGNTSSKTRHLSMIASQKASEVFIDPVQKRASSLGISTPPKGKTFRDQWMTVKMLCETIETLLEGSRTYMLEINPYLFSLDSIVEHLCAGTGNMESHEYNFPFFALHLLSNLKGVVGKALEERIVRNGGEGVAASPGIRDQLDALLELESRSIRPSRPSSFISTSNSTTERRGEPEESVLMDRFMESPLSQAFSAERLAKSKEDVGELGDEEDEKAGGEPLEMPSFLSQMPTLADLSSIADEAIVEPMTFKKVAPKSGTACNGSTEAVFSTPTNPALEAPKPRRHSVGHAAPPSPLSPAALSVALSPTSTTSPRPTSLNFSTFSPSRLSTHLDSTLKPALLDVIGGLDVSSYEDWQARYQMGLETLGRESASPTSPAPPDPDAITPIHGEIEKPLIVVPTLSSSSSYPELRASGTGFTPKGMSMKPKEFTTILHPLQIAFNAEDFEEEEEEDEDRRDGEDGDEIFKPSHPPNRPLPPCPAVSLPPSRSGSIHQPSRPPSIHQPCRSTSTSTLAADLTRTLAETATLLDRDATRDTLLVPPYAPTPSSLDRSSKFLGAMMLRREPMEFSMVILLPIGNSFFETVRLGLEHVRRIGRGRAGRSGEGIVEFGSRVVSRVHAEIFVEDDVLAEVYLQDTRSKSGTFINGVRLCDAGELSECFELRTGDIIQLGQDLPLDRLPPLSASPDGDGSEEVKVPEMFRSIKMQVVLVPGKRALSRMGETSIERLTVPPKDSTTLERDARTLSPADSLQKSLIHNSRSPSMASLASLSRGTFDQPLGVNFRASTGPTLMKPRGIKEEMVLKQSVPATPTFDTQRGSAVFKYPTDDP